MAEIEAGTLYSMNQTIMDSMKPIATEALDKAKRELQAYFMANIDEKYFMLLCKELSDYTVFIINSNLSCSVAVSELNETLDYRGEILSIGKTSDDTAFEIWIRTDEDKKVHVYYLFPYKAGIIEC